MLSNGVVVQKHGCQPWHGGGARPLLPLEHQLNVIRVAFPDEAELQLRHRPQICGHSCYGLLWPQPALFRRTGLHDLIDEAADVLECGANQKRSRMRRVTTLSSPMIHPNTTTTHYPPLHTRLSPTLLRE